MQKRQGSDIPTLTYEKAWYKPTDPFKKNQSRGS